MQENFLTLEEIDVTSEINNKAALIDEYIQICGYSEEEALIAADNTIGYDHM